jgi:hypothetical protein
MATNQTPGGTAGGLDDAHGGGITVRVATPFRRRRETARRLPALGGGHRDPLDKLAGLPIPTTTCCCLDSALGF